MLHRWALTGAVVIVLLTPRAAAAQAYARFVVPDSALGDAIRAARTDYENAWNQLLVAWLRSRAARHDSAATLGALARAVARAEPAALGSTIANDALSHVDGWTTAQCRSRVTAAMDESLAVIARNGRDWGAAEYHFESALERYEKLGEMRRRAWVKGSLGALMLLAGQPDRALPLYEDALVARRALGDPRLLGNTLNDLGQVLFQLERYPEATRYLREAGEVRERSGQLAALGGTLGFMGSALLAMGARDSAELVFNRSLELTSTAGDSARTLLTLINYGAMLMDQGGGARAESIYARAHTIASERDDLGRLALIESNLGDLYRQTGRFSDSRVHYEAALALQADDPAGQITTLNGLGRANLHMGDFEQGSAVLERARVLADSLDDPRAAARTRINLAAAVIMAGDTTAARGLCMQAVDRAAAVGDSLLVRDGASTLARILIDARRPAEAEAWVDRAVAAAPSTPEIQAALLTHRGLVRHRLGRLEDAERDYQEALALAERAGATDVAARVLTNLGDLAERRGDLHRALEYYEDAISRFDRMRGSQIGEHDAIATLASRSFVYEGAIHLRAVLDAREPDGGHAARAFQIAEAMRARALLDLLSGLAPAAPAAQARIETVQPQLGAREALLEYSVGDSGTVLWVVRRDRWKMLSLAKRSVLRRPVQTLRQDLGDPVRAEGEAATAAAQALYRELIAPAERLLSGVDRLIVSADGPLALVPFEVFLVADSKGNATKERLGTRYVVSYTPAASLLGTDGEGDGSGGVLAVGDPFFGTVGANGGSPLARLEYTADELAELRRWAGDRTLRVLSDSAATARTLSEAPELGTASVVHVATHGEAREREPLRSRLWLAPETPGAGASFVEVADVLRWRIRSELVTLSACESGVGRVEVGEGVIGLPRAFLIAGAGSVLVSYWKVADQSTARLMGQFYRRLLKDRRDRAAALADAKRALLKAPETRSPFYWAPFVLIGNRGPLAPAGRPVGAAITAP